MISIDYMRRQEIYTPYRTARGRLMRDTRARRAYWLEHSIPIDSMILRAHASPGEPRYGALPFARWLVDRFGREP